MDEQLRKKIWALENLKDRMEFNEKTKTWKIQGVITVAEYEAFIDAIQKMYHYARTT